MTSKQPVEYLSTLGVAERVGLTRGTINSYRAKGLLPDPDAIVKSSDSQAYGWLPETIDQWQANRPGRGNWRSAPKA
ncbi:MAG: transcriptional regulator [Actinomycetaceae bacterium]|nr:transcriptional regulator [Actinomycetaceae bacterium]